MGVSSRRLFVLAYGLHHAAADRIVSNFDFDVRAAGCLALCS